MASNPRGPSLFEESDEGSIENVLVAAVLTITKQRALQLLFDRILRLLSEH